MAIGIPGWLKGEKRAGREQSAVKKKKTTGKCPKKVRGTVVSFKMSHMRSKGEKQKKKERLME